MAPSTASSPARTCAARTPPVSLTAESAEGALWARAWSRTNRMLGYVLDSEWEKHGAAAAPRTQTHIHLPGIGAGTCQIEWWDCDLGVVLGRAPILHAGGDLVLDAPSFARHLAFKFTRLTP